MGSRVAHVRELKTEIARLREEKAALADELGALKAHFDQALLAAIELKDGEELEIWDGWNLILGSGKCAADRDELLAQARATGRRVWIVLDGKDENVVSDGKVRVSYTGGSGAHRADKYVCDFVRMAKYLGLERQVKVRTDDKDFRREVERIGAILV